MKKPSKLIDIPANDEAPALDRVWFRPQTMTPENGEIVVIACNVDSGDGILAQVLQTAIYQQIGVAGEADGVQELWHCGQPFKELIYWLRLPEVPKETILLPKRKLIL